MAKNMVNRTSMFDHFLTLNFPLTMDFLSLWDESMCLPVGIVVGADKRDNMRRLPTIRRFIFRKENPGFST